MCDGGASVRNKKLENFSVSGALFSEAFSEVHSLLAIFAFIASLELLVILPTSVPSLFSPSFFAFILGCHVGLPELMPALYFLLLIFLVAGSSFLSVPWAASHRYIVQSLFSWSLFTPWVTSMGI